MLVSAVIFVAQVSNANHSLSGEVHASQGQRRCKALANFSMLRMPRPPLTCWATHRRPIYLAFSPDDLFHAHLKEAPNELNDHLQSFYRHMEGGERIYSLAWSNRVGCSMEIKWSGYEVQTPETEIHKCKSIVLAYECGFPATGIAATPSATV
jgi:hypothetical protein